MNSSIRYLTGSLFFFTLAVLAPAQATTGTVLLNVSTSSGNPVPNASLSIRPLEIAAAGVIRGRSNERGLAEFANLAPGRYRLEVEASGFRNIQRYLFVISGKKEEQTVDMGPYGGIDPGLGPRKSDTVPKDDFFHENSKQLPSNPNFQSLLDIAPSVRIETLAAGISIDGATESDNTYFIDGQEVTNPNSGVLNRNYNLPFTLLQEVKVSSGVDTAEFAGSIGGVVNVVTQGGNDRWRGDFGFSFAPQGLNGGSRPILNRYGDGPGQFEYFRPNDDDESGYFPYGSIGGPVIKEKLWFFGSYFPQIENTTRVIDYYNMLEPELRSVSETIVYKQDTRQEVAYLRLDAQPVSKLRGTFSFLWNPTIQNGDLPDPQEGLSGVPQTNQTVSGAGLLANRGGRNNGNVLNGSLSWTPISRLFVNFRAGRGFLNEKLDSYGGNDRTRYLCSVSGMPQNVPGSNCFPGFNTGANLINRLDANTRTTASLEGGLIGIRALGRHLIKFGYQYDRIGRGVNQGYLETGYIVLYYGLSIANLIGLNPTGNQCDYTMNPNPANCWVGSGLMQRFGYTADTEGSNQAFYGQTNWQIGSRVTLDLGYRFENERVPLYGDNEAIHFNWNDKISPRFGAAADIFGNGKTRVYGSYFWNYDRLKNNIFETNGADVFVRDYFEILPERGVAYSDYTYDNILGGQTDPLDYQCPIFNGPGYSRCRFGFFFSNLPFPPLPVIDQNLKPTKQKVFLFGVDQALGAGFSLRGRYIRKVLDNVIEDTGFFNNQGSEAYLVTNPGIGLSCLVAMDAAHPCPAPERKYDGVELSVEKRGSRFLFDGSDYFFNVSYTWSRLYGNYSGLGSSDEFGRAAPNGTRKFDLPFEAFTANGVPNNGRLATDRPHVFKAFGGYSYRWKGNQRTDVSAFTTFQSGTPLTTIYSLYNLTTATLFGRGDLGRTEWFTETDLRLGHNFNVGPDGKYKIEVFTEFLNLFDEKNELSRQTSISSRIFRNSELTAGGCTTCQNEAFVLNTIFNQGGIEQYVVNYLNVQRVSTNGFRNDYNQPNLFQAARSARFGARVRF